MYNLELVQGKRLTVNMIVVKIGLAKHKRSMADTEFRDIKYMYCNGRLALVINL